MGYYGRVNVCYKSLINRGKNRGGGLLTRERGEKKSDFVTIETLDVRQMWSWAN